MQTNNTLFLTSEEFATLKNSELWKAYLTAKPKDKLSAESNLIFNGCVVTMESDSTIHLTQKDQSKKLQPVNKKGENLQQDYFEQYACSTYIALICQPKTSFDLFITAQH